MRRVDLPCSLWRSVFRFCFVCLWCFWVVDYFGFGFLVLLILVGVLNVSCLTAVFRSVFEC